MKFILIISIFLNIIVMAFIYRGFSFVFVQFFLVDFSFSYLFIIFIGVVVAVVNFLNI